MEQASGRDRCRGRRAGAAADSCSRRRSSAGCCSAPVARSRSAPDRFGGHGRLPTGAAAWSAASTRRPETARGCGPAPAAGPARDAPWLWRSTRSCRGCARLGDLRLAGTAASPSCTSTRAARPACAARRRTSRSWPRARRAWSARTVRVFDYLARRPARRSRRPTPTLAGRRRRCRPGRRAAARRRARVPRTSTSPTLAKLAVGLGRIFAAPAGRLLYLFLEPQRRRRPAAFAAPPGRARPRGGAHARRRRSRCGALQLPRALGRLVRARTRPSRRARHRRRAGRPLRRGHAAADGRYGVAASACRAGAARDRGADAGDGRRPTTIARRCGTRPSARRRSSTPCPG